MSPKRAFTELKRFAIQSSRDFSCPLSGVILDISSLRMFELKDLNGKVYPLNIDERGMPKLNEAKAKLKPGWTLTELTEETVFA